ncbi:MAG: HAMP domain-containing histidine kinase [Oscillospiraceae bacterium]|nr:HAMP domain-containing histidine kinase [Oscillospiraceae bacterium]
MKTTFRRHLTLILCILLGATILLGVSFRALFTRYIMQTEENSLRSTADSVGGLVKAYSAAYLNDWSFRTNLSVAASASGNDILICDAEGTVRICAADIQACEHLGRSIGEKDADLLFREGSMSMDVAASQLYGEERLAVAIPVLLEDGRPLCIILVSMPRAALTQLTGRTLRIFAMVALLVFIAAIIATPYLTRRETKPIRDMAAAAKQIAHGDYNVRVPTGHQNEEIEEMAVAFNNMTVALQNSERVRQEFVANVSHELKTPMTTIAGYLDGMIDGTIPEEKHYYYMNLVSTEVRRLSRLVRNMLDVSRLRDQGIPQDQLADFDICEAAGQALLSFEQRINRKKLNVDIDMPELGVRVHALPDAVTQVLYNLMDNAVKFVNEGGTLSVRVKPRGNSAVVTVGNTGPTIPAEELPLIFDRFHKTDKSRSTDRDGAGLGLYIVKTIVLAHGEDIYVTSRDGMTEFTFTMPLSK